MMARRTGLALLLLAAVVGRVHAQAHTLQEEKLVDSYYQVNVETTTKGKLTILQEKKQQPLDLQVTAKHNYLERALKAGTAGMAEKSARFYRSAKAVITVDGATSELSFRPERRLLIAQREKEQLLVWSPAGTLTREEKDLTEHLDSSAITGLLPTKEVQRGESWKVPNVVAQALCAFDGLTNQDLTCTFDEITGNHAVVKIAGTSNGIVHGASAKLTINGSLVFDLEKKYLKAVEWTQTDEREQSPVSPSLNVELKVRLLRTPIDANSGERVGPFATSSIPEKAIDLLACTDAQGRYELTLSRDWIPVARTPQHFVLRYLQRGDFVAQVTLTPWTKAPKGQHLTGEEFGAAMEQSPGWEMTRLINKQEVSDKIAKNGNFIYKLHALGKLNDKNVMQYFYLVAGPEGDQLVIAFTLEESQSQKLGARDEELVNSIRFPTQAEAAPAKQAGE